MSYRGHGRRENPHNNRQRSYDRFANENRADRELLYLYICRSTIYRGVHKSKYLS